MLRASGVFRHGRLSYPVGTGRIAVGQQLLPLLPSNDIFYEPAKMRMRLDKEGYLYFKNVVPREVVNNALDELASQMRASAWTLDEDRERQASLNGFTMGVPYPSPLLQPHEGGRTHEETAARNEDHAGTMTGLGPPHIALTEAIRQAVSGSSVMATVRQIFGGAVKTTALQTLHLGAPQEEFGFRMNSVLLNKGTKLALVGLVPLHDTPMHMGPPVLVRGSNNTDSYAKIRQTYGQLEVESGDVRGDGCLTHEPEELLPLGKQTAADESTGLPTVIDVNPFVSCALEAGDLLLTTVYTMQSYLTNQTSSWRLLGEAVWSMEGDDVGPDPRYMGANAQGLEHWMVNRDDPKLYPKSMLEAKKEWGLIPGVSPPAES